MRAEFTEKSYVIRVSTENDVVRVTIEKPAHGLLLALDLPPTAARAISSAMMGAAAEVKRG